MRVQGSSVRRQYPNVGRAYIHVRSGQAPSRVRGYTRVCLATLTSRWPKLECSGFLAREPNLLGREGNARCRACWQLRGSSWLPLAVCGEITSSTQLCAQYNNDQKLFETCAVFPATLLRARDTARGGARCRDVLWERGHTSLHSLQPLGLAAAAKQHGDYLRRSC